MNIKIRRRIWIPLLLLTLIGGMVLVVFKYEPVVQAFDPNAIKSQIGRRIEWKGRVTAPWGIDIFEDDKAIYAVVPGSREQWGTTPPAVSRGSS